MFKNITVGVDGSESAARAIEVAARLATTFAASLLVVHAYSPVPRWMGEPNRAEFIGQQISSGEALLTASARRLRELGVTAIESDLLEGPPAGAIVRAAQAHGSDLIVIGSRGLTPMRGLLLGSVSERVLGEAPCPVLVVPPSSEWAGAGVAGADHERKIVQEGR